MLNLFRSKVNGFSRPQSSSRAGIPLDRPNLAVLAHQPELWPQFVRACPVAQKYLQLLGPLDWTHFPERPADRAWPGSPPQPRAPYVAAFLVKVNEGLAYMSHLRRFLIEHPALVWVLGFQLVPDPTAPYGFNVAASVPGRKQLGRVLRDLPQATAQFLLTSTVHLLRAELPAELNFGQAISLDTRVIQAWVKENNPKAYVKESVRLDKTRQPAGDPDCKLGCKKKRNRPPQEEADPAAASPTEPTPPADPAARRSPAKRRPTNFSALDLYYWGYASGLIATKVPDGGEFILADLTQPFNEADASFFGPLMQQTERNLGFKPKYGALDAAFDAWYCYDYFHQAGGFAAVPLVERGLKDPQFDPAGLPLCQAGLAMPCRSTYMNNRGLVPQRMGRYGCPLLPPDPTGVTCPIDHANWAEGGCHLTMGVSPGARIRYQLDRTSPEFKAIFKQRTATERINALATDLGIEHPRLRNGRAIANQNTLLYVLLNLRAWQRVRAKKATSASA